MLSAIFTLAGAVLLMIATFSYAMVFLDGAIQESAFRLVIGGTLVGGFLGLLVAELTRPSGTRPTRLIVFGIVGGLLGGLVYGVIGLQEGCEPGSDTGGGCGWVFLGRSFALPWMPIALWIVFGGFVGALLGWTTALLVRGRERTRNLIIGSVLLVATASATVAILYSQGSRDGGTDEAALATVFFSKRDIHEGQELDPLIEDGIIIDIEVPRAALVVGALTDIHQLRGSTALVDIRRREQISINNVQQLDGPP
jgi:hypothetical protein